MPTGSLPHALDDHDALVTALGGRWPAVFLDYDGVLTPIIDVPMDAVISDRMREIVSDLARRCPVCVVSGRDRPVVQQLMGLDDLVVAGSHGFDIWHPERGTVQHPATSGHDGLVTEVGDRLEDAVDGLDGVGVERKRASVAVHFRRAAPVDEAKVAGLVERLLAERPDELKVTPGKKVLEVLPKVDWHKGAAVRYLLDLLGLAGPEYVPLYLGDDVTDEDAFRALAGTGIGIYVGDADELERGTAATFTVDDVDQVGELLHGLAR